MRRSRGVLVAVLAAAVWGMGSAVALPTIQRGDEGPLVEQLQDWLRLRGYRIADQGTFGRSTELAVRAVQRSSSIRANGVVSDETWLALVRKILQITASGDDQLTAEEAIPRILPPAFAEEVVPADLPKAVLTVAYAGIEPAAPAVLPAVVAIGPGAAVSDRSEQTPASLMPADRHTPAEALPAAAPSPIVNPPETADRSEPIRPDAAPLSILAKHEAAILPEDQSRTDILIDVPPGFEADAQILHLNSPRMTGKSVMIVQALLGQIGYKLDLDGNFGTATASAIRDFQRRTGQQVDGRVGPQTRRALVQSQIRQPEAEPFVARAAAEALAVDRSFAPASATTPPKLRAQKLPEADAQGSDPQSRISDTP